MTLRTFIDGFGVHWEVWEAHPRLVERRTMGERRSFPRPDVPRRQHEQRATPAVDGAGDGWLVFRSVNARRRQRPIPPGWQGLAAPDLESLMLRARPSGPRSRVTE